MFFFFLISSFATHFRSFACLEILNRKAFSFLVLEFLSQIQTSLNDNGFCYIFQQSQGKKPNQKTPQKTAQEFEKLSLTFQPSVLMATNWVITDKLYFYALSRQLTLTYPKEEWLNTELRKGTCSAKKKQGAWCKSALTINY